jgi:hypothetical protein
MALRFVITTDASGAITGVKQLGEAADDAGKKLDKAGQAGKQSGQDISEGMDTAGSKASAVGDDIGSSLAGGFGVAGVAATAVITAMLAELAQTQAALDETRAAGGDLAKELYANHGDLPLQDKVNKLFDTLSKEIRPNGPLQQLIDQYVDFGTVLDGVAQTAKAIGRPMDDLQDALSGDKLSESKRILREVNAELEFMKDSKNGVTFVWDRQPLEDYKTSLQGVIDQYEIASTLNTPAVMDKQRVDDLAQAWRDAGSAVGEYLTPDENGSFGFDIERWLADQENAIMRADELKADLLGLPPEIAAAAETVWKEQGIVAADAFIDTFEAASPDIQARAVSVAKEAGTASGQGWVDSAKSPIDAWNPRKDVTLGVNASAVHAWEPPIKYGKVVYAASGRPYTGVLDTGD